MDKDSIEMAKNPTSFWLKTITDLYIWGMFAALNFNLVSVEHFFFQFSVTIGDYALHPWAIVPVVIASLVRDWLVGAVYGVFCGGVLVFAAGLDNVLVLP